jgi:hypothetical protein
MIVLSWSIPVTAGAAADRRSARCGCTETWTLFRLDVPHAPQG